MRVCALVVVALAGLPARGDVLYSNFGEGDTYSLEMGATLAYGGPLGGDVYEAAVPFTIEGGDFFLDGADVAVLHNFGPDLVYADIRTDVAGAPGDVLETTSGSGVTPPFEHAPPMTLDFSGELLLEEGETYWLALRTAETDALLAWAHNVVDDFGLRAWRINGEAWETAFGTPGTDSERAVYRIHATPVPGPGVGVVLVGSALLFSRRRRGGGRVLSLET